uniref:Uncharacterized protein n=1 Tax=Faecalibaculum rodentium TaxID=1702221 RepID=A0A140DUL9_9FIRM|nr:hypothetical protein AALO17_12120 [Faecalibaculum rodentium]
MSRLSTIETFSSIKNSFSSLSFGQFSSLFHPGRFLTTEKSRKSGFSLPFGIIRHGFSVCCME